MINFSLNEVAIAIQMKHDVKSVKHYTHDDSYYAIT